MSAVVPDPVKGHAPMLPGDSLPGSDVNRASCLSEAGSPGGSGAPPINLLTSISDGLASGAIPSNWLSGVCWDTVGCNPSCLWPHSCDPLSSDQGGPLEYPLDEAGNKSKPVHEAGCATAYPFDIPHGLREVCRPGTTGEALQAQARAELAALTPVAVARYLSKSLQSAAEALPGGECVPIETGLGMLFEARAAYGAGGGVIHIPDRAVGAALGAGMIVRGGTRYTSIFGAPVVVGPGILNQQPDGSDPEPGTAWIYVSSAVDYAVDQIETITERVSWDSARQNDIRQVIVERRALVRHDPCNVFAVCVSLPAKEC